MLSTRLTTVGDGILSYNLGNRIQGARSLIERRTADKKIFGKLELSIPRITTASGGSIDDDDDDDDMPAAEPRNIIVGFVLDTSGSMQGKKIQHAINTCKKFIEVIHAERNGKTIKKQPIRAWIYVITFNSHAEVVIPFQEITKDTVQMINERLNYIGTDGCTNYQRAFSKQTEVIQDIIQKLNELHKQEHDDDDDSTPHHDDDSQPVAGGRNPLPVAGGRNPLPVAGGRNPQHYHVIRIFETDGEITEGTSDIRKLYKMMRNTSTATATTTASTATGPRFTFEDYVIGYGTSVDLGCLKELASPYPPAEVATATATDTVVAEEGQKTPNCSSLVTILNSEDNGYKVGEILFKIIMRCGNNWKISVETSGNATVELFEYQTHQWGAETTLHSMIYGEKKTLWIQYTPPPATATATATAALPSVQVKIQYENQFTAEKFTYQFKHEIISEQQDPSVLAAAADISIFDLVTPIFPLILGMIQIEIFKMFREIEADRYDKDTIVREAYKTLRMLKSMDAFAHISYPAISCQIQNFMTDVKVVLGLTVIQDRKEQRMVIHDRRICSAEQEVFNSGALISRRYVHDEEEYEEEAIRVINQAKAAAAAAASDLDPSIEQQSHDSPKKDDNKQYEEECDDMIHSRIPTRIPVNDYMDTPFVGCGGGGGGRGSRNGYGSYSEIRALCVRIATARSKKEDTTAEELYKEMQRYGGGGRYDPDEDAPHGVHDDDTFSRTPMNDDYTQRRMGMMRQMSS
jgi:hypothetical protein